MKNYISVNAKYYKASQISKIYNHNMRLATINYLLKDTDKKYKNLNYTINKNNSLLANFNEQFENKCIDQINHNFHKPKDGNENEIIDMVVALSEEQALHYLNKPNGEEELLKGYTQFLKDIEEQYGFKGLEVNLHTDEGYYDSNGDVKYNIHAHVIFLNYDFGKSKTVLRTLKAKDWSYMQDIAEQSFKKNSLDFIRGEPKDSTNKEHLERNDFILQKQQNTIKLQLIELEKNKVKYNKQIPILNENKNKYKKQRAILDRDSQEYKELTIKFKDMQQQEKKARADKKTLEADIKKLKEQSDQEIENSKIRANEINKNIKKLEATEQQHTNTINSKTQQLDTLYEEVAKNTTLNDKLEDTNKNLEIHIEKTNKEFIKNINASLDKITQNKKNSNFDTIVKNELKKQAKYPTQIKEYNNLLAENKEIKVTSQAVYTQFSEAVLKSNKLESKVTEQKNTIKKLEKEKEELQNKNHSLLVENTEQKSNINKLISIIKTITSFGGTTVKSIFDKFLPKDENSHDIKRD